MKKEKKQVSPGKNKKQEDNSNTTEKKNEKFPGYPLYPESEDIMNEKNRAEKIELDSFNDAGKEIPVIKEPEVPKKTPLLTKGSKKNPSSNEADITKEDLELLGSDEINNDGGDDEELKNRVYPVDMTGKDLDVPGAELDDDDENIGEEDEENNSYSIGGDRHDDSDDNTEKD